MLELDPRLLAGEAPVYGAFGRVAFGLPRTHFPSQTLPVGAAPLQTLAGEHRELDLGHVQPRAMLWGVMNLQLRSDAPGLSWSERLVEGGGGVGVEVVHHHHDSLGIRVVDLYHLLYAVRPVDLGPPLGDAAVAPANKGLGNDEEVGCPVTLVLVVVAGYSSWPTGKRFPHLAYELLALLIEAHLREALVVGAGVDFQNVLHTPEEGGILLWRDRPLPLEPGLDGTFLRVRRTNSREMGSSAHSRLTKRSARSRMLQRPLPLGGSEQESAIRCASCSPSSLCGLVRRGARWRRAASSPSATNRVRTRKTVERLISRASAMLVSDQAWPGASLPSSALSSMRAWLSWRAGAWLLAIKPSSLPRSSALKITGFSLLLGMGSPPHTRWRALSSGQVDT